MMLRAGVGLRLSQHECLSDHLLPAPCSARMAGLPVSRLLDVVENLYFDVPQGALPEATREYYSDPVLKVGAAADCTPPFRLGPAGAYPPLTRAQSSPPRQLHSCWQGRAAREHPAPCLPPSPHAAPVTRPAASLPT